ncbi:helix-turn-helix transcriptional regulator [Cellulomonas sp. S1-8]|uniref:helix-turn-helix transcriptional regulator n=1 Tax=Cellulomonas sp. S1-8 TaxID=2904790 RepID=UPI0022441651|nr:LuxR C-terminal-related transcriptional regulator [Cellulomonas sp. S1-8]UZN03084.1 LuxR C-terminal-related transcriptional regulator [Cellulomonas sp. S1-8]
MAVGEHTSTATGVASRRPDRNEIVRARCVRALDVGITTSLVTAVVAPAGYGKTTLLQHWSARHDAPTVVVNGASDLRAAVVTALTGEASDRPCDLTDALRAADPRTVLVVDDLHEQPTDAARELVREIATDGPLPLVLASRYDLPIAAHRLRLSGDLTDVRASQLAFTPQEVQDLARATGLPELDTDAAERLVTVTDGWAVAVRLALMSVDTDRDVSAQLRTLHPSDLDIGGYVVEEVVARLEPDVRDFVLRATTDDVIEPALADELAAGGAALLDDCVARGLFLTPEHRRGRTAYRWNPLFAAHCRALAARRQPSVALLLHRRVALHRAQDDPAVSVEHALQARDRELARAVLTNRWPELVLSDRGQDVLALTEQTGALHDLGLEFAHDVVQALLRGAPPAPPGSAGPVPLAVAALLTETDAARAASAADAVRTHLPTVPASQAATRALLLFALAASGLERTDDPVAVGALLGEAAALRDAQRLPVLVAACRAHRALLLVAGGAVREADAVASAALRAAEEVGAARASALVPAHLTRALVALWQARLPDVGVHVEAALTGPRCARHAAVCRVAAALHADADLAADVPGAARRLHDARFVGGDVPPLWADLLDVAGAVADALTGIDTGAQGTREGHEARTAPSVGGDLRAAWEAARLADAGLRVPARALLDDLSERAPVGVVRARVALAEAVLDRHHGEPTRAHARLEEALTDAVPDALVLPFLPSGTTGRDLLVAHLAWGTQHGATIRLALRLAAARERVPAEHLTSREREVLLCLRAGMSSREIADALVVSVNTVKTHQRGVYRKLDVPGRREAVREATARGLLD